MLSEEEDWLLPGTGAFFISRFGTGKNNSNPDAVDRWIDRWIDI